MNSHLLAADIIYEVVKVKRGIMRQFTYSKGSCLLETMIVLLFLGILAGCDNTSGTNPGSSNTTARNFLVVTKQWEAKQILKQIYVMELAYHQEKNTYWPPGANATAIGGGSFADIDVGIPAYSRYSYTISATITTFQAYATSTVLDNDATLDSWYITDLGQLVVTSDDAAD